MRGSGSTFIAPGGSNCDTSVLISFSLLLVTAVPAEPVRVKPPSPQEIAAGDAIKLADLLAAEAHDEHDDHPHESTAGQVKEIGGRRDGPDPTRYGDWEKNGRCIDF